MRSMRRLIFHGVGSASALLSALVIVLWVISYRAPRYLEFGAPLHNGSIESSSDWAWRIMSAAGAIDVEPVCSFYSWHIPYWKLVCLFLILPTLRASRL